MQQHRLIIEKTARYFTSVSPGENVKHVLFVCHGYAQAADAFLEKFSPLFREDLLIVAPEGLHRFYLRGAQEDVVASWMTREDRLNDIRDYVAFLDRVYADVMRQCTGRVHVTVLGFSQGAATASRWMAMGKSAADKLILWCGFFPPDMPVGGIPGDVRLIVVTASDDKFISPEQEREQMILMKKYSPGLEHIRFTGKHEIDLAVLAKLI